VAGLALLASVLGGGVLPPPAAGDAGGPTFLSERSRSTGGLTEIRRRKYVRALVSYSQTNFFIEGGRAYGLEYELLKAYERQLNAGLSHADVPITMVFVPVPFGDLVPALLEGRGDIVAAGITATRDERHRVAFSAPYISSVKEVVVAHRGAERPTGLWDLGGREVYVRQSSSYAQHLERLNHRLLSKGRAPVRIVEGNRYLQAEDILDMVNAGIVSYTVVEQHVADLWASVLPDIVVCRDVVLHSGGRVAWAVRAGNPDLLASVSGFLRDHGKGSLLGNILFRRYFENTTWIANPTTEHEREKLATLVDLFKKYGDRYGFDWVLIAAQAYQESRLDQSLVSPRGAVGVMQLLPSTAADVGIPDEGRLESNIHAGVKYLHLLRDRYFSDPEIPPEARLHFAHAAYNAGPRRVREMRAFAAGMGLDPDRWFGHVEQAALRLVGQETVRYVANVQKYYAAYSLVIDKIDRRQIASARRVAEPMWVGVSALRTLTAHGDAIPLTQ
jgi:membrane-bound lytic murein transglycosylase MltF